MIGVIILPKASLTADRAFCPSAVFFKASYITKNTAATPAITAIIGLAIKVLNAFSSPCIA